MNLSDPERVLKVPHVCWNRVYRAKISLDRWAGSLLNGLPEGMFMYFAHSFYVRPDEQKMVIATTKYGNIEFCSALHHQNIFAYQCHPERSGLQGLKVYSNLAYMLNGSA
jgi:glutamine amidotransferase